MLDVRCSTFIFFQQTSRSPSPLTWDDENSHIGALNFYPIFIPLFERKVSGVSVQDMLLRLPFMTPDT